MRDVGALDYDLIQGEFARLANRLGYPREVRELLPFEPERDRSLVQALRQELQQAGICV